MTTLHLTADEISSLHHGEDGSLTIELTEPGARTLYLQSLSTEELVKLGTKRFGGPEPDVAAECARRMRIACDKILPAMEALRRAGVLNAA